jgi:hypothetical protein
MTPVQRAESRIHGKLSPIPILCNHDECFVKASQRFKNQKRIYCSQVAQSSFGIFTCNIYPRAKYPFYNLIGICTMKKKFRCLCHMSINIKYQVVLLIKIKKDEMTTHTHIKSNSNSMHAG